MRFIRVGTGQNRDYWTIAQAIADLPDKQDDSITIDVGPFILVPWGKLPEYKNKLPDWGGRSE